MPETPPIVFVARELTKTYRLGEVEVLALRALDLEIYEGEFVVLLGPSGSGKSTLLNILGGLDVPTSGAASWREHDLATADEAARTRYRREHVGFVFQFYNLIPSLTARENVALVTAMAAHPMDPDEALALVGLSERRDRLSSQLSGGEQQRVAIAHATAKRLTSCYATNQRARWIIRRGSWSLKLLGASIANSALRSSSLLITPPLVGWRTG